MTDKDGQRTLRPGRGKPLRLATVRKPDYTPLQGTDVSDPDMVRAFYQAGDFRYQFRTGDGVSRILNCNSPATRDRLVEEVKNGYVVIIEPPRRP